MKRNVLSLDVWEKVCEVIERYSCVTEREGKREIKRESGEWERGRDEQREGS